MYDSKTINTAKFLTNSKQLKNESISHYEINFERKKVYQILNEEILKGNSEIENIFTLKNENIINMLRTNIQLFDPHVKIKLN